MNSDPLLLPWLRRPDPPSPRLRERRASPPCCPLGRIGPPGGLFYHQRGGPQWSPPSTLLQLLHLLAGCLAAAIQGPWPSPALPLAGRMVRRRRAMAPVTTASGAAAATAQDARSGALEGGSGALWPNLRGGPATSGADHGPELCGYGSWFGVLLPLLLVTTVARRRWLSFRSSMRRPACGGAVVLCCPRELMRALSAGRNGCTHIHMLTRPLFMSTEVRATPFVPSLVHRCLLGEVHDCLGAS